MPPHLPDVLLPDFLLSTNSPEGAIHSRDPHSLFSLSVFIETVAHIPEFLLFCSAVAHAANSPGWLLPAAPIGYPS